VGVCLAIDVLITADGYNHFSANACRATPTR
jgi:hypothetical protein